MLALSTLCGPAEWSLDRVVASFREFGVRAIALHRAPRAEESVALRPLAARVSIVAVCADGAVEGVGEPILVVEGGAAGEEREATLEELCRRLHGLREFRVALRTPPDASSHPAPGEIALVREALPRVGYWHDAARGGTEYLDAAGRALRGASFHPLGDADLAGLRDALAGSAPAVVECPPGTSGDEIAEALRRARSFFGA